MADVETGTLVSEDEEQRKQAMRKAGQDYFNRVLEQANKGGDPFARKLQNVHASPGFSSLPGITEDPDLVAFGMAFEGSKLYLLMALMVFCQSSSWVSLKGAILAIPTPGVLAFLHMLGVVLSTWAFSVYDFIDTPSMTSSAVKGCSVRAALHGIQTWAAFSALLNGSVYFVLSWVSALPALIEITGAQRYLDMRPNFKWILAVGLALGGAGLELASDHHRSVQSGLLLLLWAAARAAEHAWHYLKQDPTGNGYISDVEMTRRIRELADLEQDQNGSTLLLMQNGLAAVPVLVLGLCCFEGSHLVDHEPSVPGLTVMLTACLMYSLASHCQALLVPRLGAKLPVPLQAAAGTTIVTLDFLERAHELSRFALLGALLAVYGAAASAWQRATAAMDKPPVPSSRPVG